MVDSCGISAKTIVVEDRVGTNLTPVQKALGYIERAYTKERTMKDDSFAREDIFEHSMIQNVLNEYGLSKTEKDNVLFTLKQWDEQEKENTEDFEYEI